MNPITILIPDQGTDRGDQDEMLTRTAVLRGIQLGRQAYWATEFNRYLAFIAKAKS